MTAATDLLREVEACIALTGVSESAFGLAAAGNPSFVGRLRRGSSPRDATVSRVRDHIAQQRQEHTPKSTGGGGKPKIKRDVIRAAAIDGRDLPTFVTVLIDMGLECWRDDRILAGEAVA